MPITDCRFIELPKLVDARGALTFVEGGHHIPFTIERMYFLSEMPAGAARGAHAHKDLEQLFLPLSGAFDLVIDDGQDRRTVHLDRSHLGFYVTPMIWRDVLNFSAGAVCCVLASKRYDESDYYRRYDDFLAAVRARRR